MPRLLMSLLLIGLLLLVAVPVINAQQSGCVNSVTVWDGDSLFGIAARYGVNAAELAQANGLAPNARLLIGQVLCLDGLVAAQPASATSVTPAASATASPTATATASATTAASPTASATATATATTGTGGPTTGTSPSTGTTTGTAPTRVLGFVRNQGNTLPAGWREYVVVAGDNLFKISQQFSVQVQEIAQANNIANLSIVFLGESLRIPPSSTGNTANPNPGSVGWVLPNGPNTLPIITLQPTSAKPGVTVTVSGSNYPPNATVNLYIEKPSMGLKSDILATVKADANGRFQHPVTIPATWPGGAAVNQITVSISGYTTQGGFWGMNYFVNQ